MDAEQRARLWAIAAKRVEDGTRLGSKETGMALYNYVYEKPARKHFQWWYNWAVRSRLEPMEQKAAMLKQPFDNIITYLRHRITNASSESLNAKIQWVK